MPVPPRLRPPTPSAEEVREYVALCRQIEDAHRDDVGPLLARWNARAGRSYTQAEFQAYYGSVAVETFVGEMLLGVPALVPDLTYDEFRDVLRSAVGNELSEAVASYYLNWLEANLPGANVSDLLYWPNEWFRDEAMLQVELTPDQVLAYAMARSGRRVPGAPADVPMPYAMP
ncbi:MAG: hypothetical protein J0I06_14835 [Planctomycetes bacterium]|nr:hypothetical protein [Planctomycetota bacterium]